MKIIIIDLFPGLELKISMKDGIFLSIIETFIVWEKKKVESI